MILSERTHYCMFCPASGSWRDHRLRIAATWLRARPRLLDYAPHYEKAVAGRCHAAVFCDGPRALHPLPAVHPRLQFIAANHTLGVHQRGARTMIGADDDVPFGGSSCVSCGSCLQVCPTGALNERHSAFLGHERISNARPLAWAAPWVAASKPSCATIICARRRGLGRRQRRPAVRRRPV